MKGSPTIGGGLGGTFIHPNNPDKSMPNAQAFHNAGITVPGG